MPYRSRFASALVALLLVVVLPSAALAAPAGQNFGTHLSGSEEVPARETDATGQAAFALSKDGTELRYRLIVSNIENVVASHIHHAPAGSNGPVVAWLAGPFAAGGGRTDGVLATGTITAADVIGMTLEDLVAAMRAGNTYVNVHTNDGVAPANEGPGDFPGGEVRGQIEPHGPHA